MVRLAVSGALGRMGSGILKTAFNSEDFDVVAAFDAPGKEEIGRDIGEALGIGKINLVIASSEDMEKVLRDSRVDVLIDFTAPEASLRALEACAATDTAIVIGTTGFTGEQLKKIESMVEASNIALVLSPNMATGVNVFFKIAAEIAETLGDEYDIEIIDIHHRYKKDAPSGTALKAGELIAERLGRDIDKVAVFGRQGKTGERSRKEIGFHAVRAGDIVGEHFVIFAGEGERIELVHRAHSRQAFVNGALKAALFVVESEKGKIYSTFDVLGL